MNKQDLVKKINDLLIIKQDDNSYHLFGQYTIVKNNGLYHVSVPNTLNDNKLQFAELRHAVTWCVFHKHKKHKDLIKIEELDEKLCGLQLAIANLKRLVEKSKENKPIYLAKLYEDKIKKKQAQRDMDVFINASKYWQTKSFKENQHL